MKKIPTDTLFIVINGEITKYAVSPNGIWFYWYETQGDAEKDILPSEYTVRKITQKQLEEERGW